MIHPTSKSSRNPVAVGGENNRLLIFSADVRHDILIEELENQWYTIGEHQMLRHEFKLVNVIHLQMFQQQQQNGRHGFHQNLFVTIDVNTQFHRLQHRHPVVGKRREEKWFLGRKRR